MVSLLFHVCPKKQWVRHMAVLMSSIDSSSPRVLGAIACQAVHRFSAVWNELKRGRSPMLPFFGDLPGTTLHNGPELYSANVRGVAQKT